MQCALFCTLFCTCRLVVRLFVSWASVPVVSCCLQVVNSTAFMTLASLEVSYHKNIYIYIYIYLHAHAYIQAYLAYPVTNGPVLSSRVHSNLVVSRPALSFAVPSCRVSMPVRLCIELSCQPFGQPRSPLLIPARMEPARIDVLSTANSPTCIQQYK